MLLKVLLFLENQSSSSVNMDKCFLCSFMRFFRYILILIPILMNENVSR